MVSFFDHVIKFQGKMVNFGAEEINDIYGILNENMDKFEAKGCEQWC